LKKAPAPKAVAVKKQRVTPPAIPVIKLQTPPALPVISQAPRQRATSNQQSATSSAPTLRNRVDIRTVPDLKSKVLCRVTKKGTSVKVLGYQNDWFKVKLGSCEGWVTKKDIQYKALPEPEVVVQKQPPVKKAVAAKKQPPVTKKAVVKAKPVKKKVVVLKKAPAPKAVAVKKQRVTPPAIPVIKLQTPPALPVISHIAPRQRATSNQQPATSSTPTLLAILQQLNELKQKVGQLQKQSAEQEEIISRQRKALDKIAEISPGVKEALLPPEPKFLVSYFTITGAELFATEDFEFILKKYRGQKLGMRDLNKIADEITGFYRSKGYITSLAFVPGQDVTDTGVELKVIEGVVGEIEVEEGEENNKKAIQRKFLVKKGDNLKYQELQKSIRRINRQPDRTVKAVLKPGAEKGTSDIFLKLKEEKDPKHFYLEYSNRGTEVTGKDRYGASFVHNNLLGNDDILTARFRMGEDSDIYSWSLDYNSPVNRYDTRVGAYGAYSRADIAGQFEILKPEGRATAWGVYVGHPLFDRDFTDPSLNLSGKVTAGMDFVDVKNRILNKETSHDQLTVSKVGISFDEKDRFGRTFFSNELRVGIDHFLGSMDEHDPQASRLDSGGEFVKYVGSLSRVTRLPLSSLLVTSIRGQYTDGPIVNSEQLSYGGADSIRGFPENDYLADYGWLSTIEIRTPAFLFPRILTLPYSKEKVPLRDAMQFVYFIDFGEGSLKNARVGEDDSRFLSGAGIGLRFEFYKHLQGTVDWGFAVGNEDPSDGSSNTVHVGLRYEL